MPMNERQIIENFFKCIDEVAAAERRGSLKEMRFYLKKASGYPIVSDFQKWEMDYTRAMVMLLYEPHADKREATKELLRLRLQAKADPDVLYKCVEETYFRLLIHVLQQNYTKMMEIPEYEELALELIEIIEHRGCSEMDEDDTYAFAYCVLAVYYETRGRFLAASKYYGIVWQRTKGFEYISRYVFCTLVYYLQNLIAQGNLEYILEITDFLAEKVSDKKIKEPYHEDLQRFLALYCTSLKYRNQDDKILNLLGDVVNGKMLFAKDWSENALMLYGTYLYELDRCRMKYPWKQRLGISAYLQKYERKAELEKAQPWVQFNYYMTYYYHEKLMNRKRAVRYLDQCAEILRTAEFDERDRMPFLNGIASVIQEYKILRRKQEVLNCIENFMHKNIEFYSMAEYYSDNEKMERYLGICDLCFKIAYQASIDVVTDEKKMEYSLNGKKLLSSVIRLRNQAYAQNEDSLYFREKHADALHYFSLEQLKQVMPQDTVIVDFVYSDPQIYTTKKLLADASGNSRFLDIFVLAKRGGRCSSACKRIDNVKELDEKIHTLLERMKAPAGKVNRFAGELWMELMQPFEKLRKGIERLWICPDGEVSSLPIETLMELAPDVQPIKEVVYWHSLRDIFEIWMQEELAGENACMIGNPRFSVDEENADREKDAAAREELWFAPLPYSEYEAKKIARMTAGICYTNNEATKYRITPGYRYIHVATHGIHQEQGNHPWHESALAFAGVWDYERKGKEQEGYGNGILSAEEISRMNLRGTEVVVLSACDSGSSQVSEMQQQSGLHIAFGAAGVKYIIASLWKVDDFAATVLMTYFYENLENGVAVPVSLAKAKLQLKETTVHKLKEIIQEDEDILPEAASEMRTALAQLPDEYPLFASVKYWGSFVCMQTMC